MKYSIKVLGFLQSSTVNLRKEVTENLKDKRLHQGEGSAGKSVMRSVSASQIPPFRSEEFALSLSKHISRKRSLHISVNPEDPPRLDKSCPSILPSGPQASQHFPVTYPQTRENTWENQHPKMRVAPLTPIQLYKGADVQNIYYSIEEITDTLTRSLCCNPPGTGTGCHRGEAEAKPEEGGEGAPSWRAASLWDTGEDGGHGEPKRDGEKGR